ncbi:unnamed protein product (macronuclear) [Paramecium tetraurelia]|uniref:Cache domain-containing protein n=1 Tax=Paramecium tetraurelia TaxID=5888 RepID=A0DDN3_PARTE|nr:uncharacterized protein GSPATT00015991001 [Paramecium tetraurelia]CAK81150.1 unnamed protein product [Paramecium tetraurelia]|eukprot:XP_001448547.1 hypothetical protein (macronuclear) [Paramecium tetraurelia strain d4-2]
MILNKLKNQPKWYLKKDWRIKTQILVAYLIVYLFIFSLLTTAVMVSQNYLHEMLTLFSHQVFLKQTRNSLEYQWVYKRGLEETLFHTAQQISFVRDFNQLFDSLVANHSLKVKEHPMMCLNDPRQNDSYCYTSSVSCGIFGKPTNNFKKLGVESVLLTTSYLTSFRFSLDGKSPIYYFNNNNATQLYCITLGLQFPKTFNPLKRQYYLDHLHASANATNPKTIYIVNPYAIITNAINFPMTTNLLDKNDGILGIIVKGIELDYATLSKFNGNNTQILIIDKKGKVLLSELYNSKSQPIYFLNESQFSGFDSSDLEQILFHHYQKEFVSNCDNIISTNILCRYNSLDKDNLIIESMNISNSPFIMVMLQKTNFIIKQEAEFLEILAAVFREDIRNTIIFALVIPIFILFCSQFLINIILNQLNGIIYDVKAFLYSNKKEYLSTHLFKKKSIIISESIIEFQAAIINLFQHQVIFKKSNECISVETIQFPVYTKLYKFLVNQLQQIIQKKRLKNNFIPDSLTLFELKKILFK